VNLAVDEESVIENYYHMCAPIGDARSKLEKADIAVIGVPFESTVTCRPGTRYGPSSIREVTWNFWTYNLYLGIDPFETLKIVDYGDLKVVHGNFKATARLIEKAVREILSSGAVPFVLGGEHTISYPVIKTIGGEIGVVQFDAHMDLMDTSEGGEKLCHESVMRRVCEAAGSMNVVQIGIRTASAEEHSYARKEGIKYYTPLDVSRKGINRIMSDVLRSMDRMEGIYVTIDIDALDPSYAPGTGCHEPNGLSIREMITAIHSLDGAKLVGLDIVEVSPAGRFDPTPSVAAKLILEALAVIARDKVKR
jgi:agmatinase